MSSSSITFSFKEKRKICPAEEKDKDLPRRRQVQKSGQAEAAFTLQQITLETAGVSTKVQMIQIS